MLDRFFLNIINMSFTASCAIIIVFIARLFLSRTAKRFSYILWSVVLFRLICPFSVESIISFLPVQISPIPQKIVYEDLPKINTNIPIVDNIMNRSLPAATPYASINPLQVWLFLGRTIWLIVIAGLLIYSVVSLIRLHSQLRDAVCEKDNIYSSANLGSAFVIGVFHPRIYLPKSLTPEEKRYILLHEQIHIRRFDHLIKMIGFLVLCLHWFNPLVWVAFFLSTRDMEMSCDESVIQAMGERTKKEYCLSLLSLATGRRLVGGTPLAFGEGDTKGRIKNVLSYKKPAFRTAAVAMAVVAVICIGLAVNPKSAAVVENANDSIIFDEDFNKNEIKRLQLQSRLQETILGIDEVGEATVLIDVGTRDGGTSVYITFTAAPNRTVSAEQQRGIENLALNSLPGLTKERVYISAGHYGTIFKLHRQGGEIIESNLLSSPRVATELAALLLSGTTETQNSVTDIPTDAEEYLEVEIGEDTGRTYYVYQAQDTFWVEEPRDYKRELDKKTYEAIMAYLYKYQSQGSMITPIPTHHT